MSAEWMTSSHRHINVKQQEGTFYSLKRLFAEKHQFFLKDGRTFLLKGMNCVPVTFCTAIQTSNFSHVP